MSEMNHHHHDEKNEMKAEGRHPAVKRDERYWLSLEQWGNDPEFQKVAEQEFMSSPLREKDGQDGFARREFLKLMGASLAMATAGCVRRPVQNIIPYNKQPEEVTNGVANYYTSSYFDGQEVYGLLVKTREGRPIKVEGNPSATNKGGLSVRAHAHILKLYDPERLQGPKHNLMNKEKTNFETVGMKWEALDKAVAEQLKKGSVAVLTSSLVSPSQRLAVKEFAAGAKAEHYVWSPLADAVAEGQKLSYGEAVEPQYRFDKAKVIVSVDADFLGAWGSAVANAKQFSSGRKDIVNMSRLVVFDSNYSLTGANADIRVRIKPSQQLKVVLGLAHEIVVKKSFGKFAGDARVKSVLESYANVEKEIGMESGALGRLAADLIEHKGKGLVVAGGIPTQTTAANDLQVAVNFLNSVLGNDGETVVARNARGGAAASQASLKNLVAAMNDKKVKTLIVHGVNPAYVSEAFKEAARKVEMVIYTGDRVDETGRVADIMAPDHHPMESWGDAELASEVFAIQQPTIRPMYDTRAFVTSLGAWAKAAGFASGVLKTESDFDAVQYVWKMDIHSKVGKGKSFADFWDATLQEGVVNAEAAARSGSERSFKIDALVAIKKTAAVEGMELVLYPKVAIGDGSLANIAWLQELPDPVTKVCWDNYASVSIATAKKLKVQEGNILKLTVGDKTLEAPVHIQPGLHDEVVAVAVGYGRTHAGKVGNGIGFNAYTLATGGVFAGQAVKLEKTGKEYVLANPQGNQVMEGRTIVAEATLADYKANKEAGTHKHKTWSIWSGHQYNGNKWGMAIDLNSCTGCSACMVACQSENNIPVVGKRYVIEGREMYWIRVDRYYVGDPVDAQVVYQPMMCQQCDNAPCETVCPVAATVHSDEGLNDMVYNRCVGTRYCSNNCPYKVRRFNWFAYAQAFDKPMHLAFNPDVTVRMRGVMEKCSFCVQRIKEKKNTAKLEGRSVKDGEIKTACQQSCPTDAIIFGDLNDKNSQVAKVFADEPRAYTVLEEFNAGSSVRYMTKIRNNGKKGEHV